jgi:hypothetical protein
MTASRAQAGGLLALNRPANDCAEARVYVRLSLHSAQRIVREFAPFLGSWAPVEMHFDVPTVGRFITWTTIGEAERSFTRPDEPQPFAVVFGVPSMEAS